jgi:hypothetical protein
MTKPFHEHYSFVIDRLIWSAQVLLPQDEATATLHAMCWDEIAWPNWARGANFMKTQLPEERTTIPSY